MADTAFSREFLELQEAVSGRYTLERELGRGGMGVVFLARDSALDRPVALKLLPPYLAAQPELRERFVQEARVVARLSHPNIVTVYAAEQLGDLVYFAMAYIRGETLTQRVERAGPIPPAQATRMLQELAWGLGYAHANGVVHRDVKPDNILIEQASGRAMLADFGVAYAADASRQTAAGQLIGTPHYVSPEQAYGNPLDGRSDLYSLGASAFFALTGRTLFDAPSPYAVITKHLNEPPPSLATVRPDLPRQLAVAVDRCLAKDPEQRFPSGEALAEALAATGLTEHEVPAPIRHYFRQGRGIALAWLTVAALALWFGRWLEIPPDPVSRGAAIVLFLIAVFWPLAFLLPDRPEGAANRSHLSGGSPGGGARSQGPRGRDQGGLRPGCLGRAVQNQGGLAPAARGAVRKTGVSAGGNRGPSASGRSPARQQTGGANRGGRSDGGLQSALPRAPGAIQPASRCGRGALLPGRGAAGRAGSRRRAGPGDQRPGAGPP